MSSENPNTCLLCDVKCVSSDALDFHVKTVHLRLFVCTKCPDYTTMIHAKLVRHVANEHKEIPKVKNVILNVSKPKEVSKAKLIVIEANRTSSPDVEVIESKTTPTLTSRPTTLIQPQSKQPLSLDDEDNSDSDVNTFECDHCWFTTRDREDMINHLVQKHGFGQTAAKHHTDKPALNNRDSSLEQEQTPTLSASTLSLIDPPPSQASSRKCIMKCGLCEFRSSNLDEINNHIGKDGHFGPGKQPICPHCPFLAANPKELLDHGKSHFVGFVLVTYICSVCSFKASSLANIEKHQQVVHSFSSPSS